MGDFRGGLARFVARRAGLAVVGRGGGAARDCGGGVLGMAEHAECIGCARVRRSLVGVRRSAYGVGSSAARIVGTVAPVAGGFARALAWARAGGGVCRLCR